MKHLTDSLGTLAVPFLFLLYIGIPIGTFYWVFLSIKIGSFAMFLMGIFPVTIIFTGPVGLYCLIMDTPRWIYSVFG